MGKISDSGTDDDTDVLSTKFKKLKSDATLAVTGGDLGQAPLNDDVAQAQKPMVKKRRLFKTSEVEKASATASSQMSDKDGEAAVHISNSSLPASKKQRRNEEIDDQVQYLMSDIQRKRTSESEFERVQDSRVFKASHYQHRSSPQEPISQKDTAAIKDPVPTRTSFSKVGDDKVVTADEATNSDIQKLDALTAAAARGIL